MKRHSLFPAALLILPLLLILTLAACGPRPTATPTGTATPSGPTPTPPPLAPRVISISPARGEELPPDQPITVTFDRPLDADSLDLTFEPKLDGQTNVKGAQVLFQPASYKPGERYTLQLSAASGGLNSGPLRFRILTQGYLEVASTTPGDGNKRVSTDNPITIVFNRPVVPLGVPGDDPTLPQPLTLNPASNGSGEWLNTSIYMFHPKPPLLAGTVYTATVADIADLTGSTLAAPYVFGFTTETPVVRDVQPTGVTVPPTTTITITFSQPMDAASTTAALSVTTDQTGATPVAGDASWSEDLRTLTFAPAQPLPHGSAVKVEITTDAKAYGGAAGLRQPYTHTFTVVPYPAIVRTQPKDGEQNVPLDDPVQVFFSAPILEETLKLSISPPISATQLYTWYSPYDNIFTIVFPREPRSSYTVTLASGIADPYGNKITEPTVVRFRTGDRQPFLNMLTPGVIGAYNAYTDTVILFNHVNIADINAALYRLTPEQFVAINPADNYEGWRTYSPPANQLVRKWTIRPNAPRNQVTTTRELLLDDKNRPLGPGLYYLNASSPQVTYGQYDMTPRVLLVVSPYNVVIKRGLDDALVWVTDLASGQPVADVPVTIYPAGADAVTGGTNAEGVFQANVPISTEPWRATDAYVGTPNKPGWSSTNWSQGISPWNYDLPSEYYNQPYRVHLYTERPLYRAGDTIHFRAIIRNDNDADYTIPTDLPVTVRVRNPRGDIIYTSELRPDAYGAIYGDVPLATETELGVYGLEAELTKDQTAYASFLVAAFRKPEFEVFASVTPEEVLATQSAQAATQAAYFFGGPVKDAKVRWTVTGSPYTFSYESDEPWSFADFRPDVFYEPMEPSFGGPIASGEGKTDGEGKFTVAVPTDLAAEPSNPEPASSQRTVEFTITDINDQAVSKSTSYIVHAAGVYPGVRPDSYVGKVGEDQIARFIAVDALERQPKPEQKLEVTVSRLEWRTVRQRGADGRLTYTSKVEETGIVTETLTTGADGQAQLSWRPTDAGEYLIRAVARDALGNANRSAAFAWVSGPEYAPWQIENDDRIELVADRDKYQVGDTAQVLVPSPFQGETTALVTIERAGIFSHEVRTLKTNSEVLSIPILPEYAPNVFVSVVLISPPVKSEPPTFKLGLAELKVDPGRHLLNLTITASPDPAQPGDAATYEIRATDWQNKPVQAQFSLALVDRALLSLRPDDSPDIAATFWGQRGLGVQTGVTLVASLNRVDEAQTKGTKGGGGGFAEMAELDIRTDFRDLAFWKADVETDANGQATVEIPLPDNLTTWQMRAIGATKDTSVADGVHNLLVTKPLFVRPVLPRFVVHDDRFTVGAIVQNNTGEDQNVNLSLDMEGLTPQADTTFQLAIPNGERVRVDVPVVVDDIDPTSQLVREDVVVRMTADAGAYQDAVELSLPVERYSSPETYASAGIVPPDEPRIEAVALPDLYDPTQGDLTVRLEPSLAAGMTGGLTYLEHYPYECTEQTVSRFLPNVLTARALAELGLNNPDLAAKLDEQVSVGLQRLYTRQNVDGGWGWFAQEKSNPYTSAYVLFGLVSAKESGYDVDTEVMARGARFLQRQLKSPDKLEGYKLNQQAFFVYVLDRYAVAAGGERPLSEAQLLYEERERMALYAQAYLALTLQSQSAVADTAAQAQALLDDLSGRAINSATGAHWEEERPHTDDWWTMNTDTRTTSIILDAIIAIQPDHPLGPNVVRWLMSARTADRWESTHETAWALIALTDWLVASGELQANYAWDVALNGAPIGSGTVTPDTVLEAETLQVAIADLLADQLNILLMERTPGPGQLYYTAYLRAFLPVPDLKPVSRGLTIARRYTLHTTDESDAPAPDITSANVGDIIDVELTIVAPSVLHYLLVEDPIPAGTEPIDTSLATTSQQLSGPEVEQQQGEGEPRPYWWDWWWTPTSFELKDDKVAMFATELLPGAYTFRYQLRASIAGDFNVLPPRGDDVLPRSLRPRRWQHVHGDQAVNLAFAATA